MRILKTRFVIILATVVAAFCLFQTAFTVQISASPTENGPSTAMVGVLNNSHHDVWVDISTGMSRPGHGQGAWTIRKAFCEIPGQDPIYSVFYGDVPAGAQPAVRVRAEIKESDCHSATIRTLQAVATRPSGAVNFTQRYLVTDTHVVLVRNDIWHQ